MDRKENYEEESMYTEEGEITLRGIGRFLKRAWLRTLIYLLVALVIATALFAGFKYIVKTEYSISATVEFTFDGISTGKNPDGSTFNKDDIRSIDNVRTAIIDAGLTEKVLNSGDVTSARNHISVTAIMPNEYVQKYNDLIAGGMNSADAYSQLAAMTFYPTKFVISLRNYEELGLDKTDANVLIDSLIDNYSKLFSDKYNAAVIFSDAAFNITVNEDGTLGDLDYIDYIDNFELSYNNIREYLTRMTSSVPSFVSSGGKSFSALGEELAFLLSQLSSAKAFITNANVSNNLDNMKVSTQNQIDTLKRQSDNLAELIAATSEQLNNIKPQTTTVTTNGQTSIITTYPESYNELVRQRQNYIVQKSNVDLSLEEKQYLYEKIREAESVSSSDKEEADRRINSIMAAAKTFIAEVNTASTENSERSAGSDSFSIISPAAYVYTSMSFPTMLVYIVAVVVAIAAAFIVTYALGKRNKNRKKAEAKVAAELASEEKESK